MWTTVCKYAEIYIRYWLKDLLKSLNETCMQRSCSILFISSSMSSLPQSDFVLNILPCSGRGPIDPRERGWVLLFNAPFHKTRTRATKTTVRLPKCNASVSLFAISQRVTPASTPPANGQRNGKDKEPTRA